MSDDRTGDRLWEPVEGGTGILGCNGVGPCPAGSFCLRDVPCVDRLPADPYPKGSDA